MLAFRRSTRAASKPSLWLIALILIQSFWNPPEFISRSPPEKDDRVGGFDYHPLAGTMGAAGLEYRLPYFAGWPAPDRALCEGGSGPAVGNIWRILYERDDVNRPEFWTHWKSLIPLSVRCRSEMRFSWLNSPDFPFSGVPHGTR